MTLLHVLSIICQISCFCGVIFAGTYIGETAWQTILYAVTVSFFAIAMTMVFERISNLALTLHTIGNDAKKDKVSSIKNILLWNRRWRIVCVPFFIGGLIPLIMLPWQPSQNGYLTSLYYYVMGTGYLLASFSGVISFHRISQVMADDVASLPSLQQTKRRTQSAHMRLVKQTLFMQGVSSVIMYLFASISWLHAKSTFFVLIQWTVFYPLNHWVTVSVFTSNMGSSRQNSSSTLKRTSSNLKPKTLESLGSVVSLERYPSSSPPLRPTPSLTSSTNTIE